MKNPMTVLVVEDNPKHLADLVEMLHVELPRLPIKLDLLYAQDLEKATELISSVDAVVTDVFFPEKAGGSEAPNGTFIIEECLQSGKPVVWVTSTYHHGAKTNDVSEWGRQHGLEMFDCSSTEAGGRDGEAPRKPWKQALYGLIYTVVAIEQNLCTFTDGKLKFAYGVTCQPYVIAHFLSSEKLDMDSLAHPTNDPVLQRMVELGFLRV